VELGGHRSPTDFGHGTPVEWGPLFWSTRLQPNLRVPGTTGTATSTIINVSDRDRDVCV
jgi:hypothetical protein